MIPITCPGCKVGFEVPENLAGKTIRCTSCKTELTIPAAADGSGEKKPFGWAAPSKPAPAKAAVAVAAVAVTAKPAVAAKPVAVAAKPVSAKPAVEVDEKAKPTKKPVSRHDDDDDDDDDDDRPAKAKKNKKGAKKGGNPAMLFGLIGAGVLLIGGGIAAAVMMGGKKDEKKNDSAGGGSPNTTPATATLPTPPGGGLDPRNGGNVTAPSGWKKFNGEGFSVLMPGDPDTDSVLPPDFRDLASAGTMHKSGSELQGELYVVMALTLNPNKGLNDITTFLEKDARKDGEQLTVTDTTVSGLPAKEFKFVAKRELGGMGRVVVSGNRGYFFATVSKGDASTSPTVKTFLDSIQITGGSTSEPNTGGGIAMTNPPQAGPGVGIGAAPLGPMGVPNAPPGPGVGIGAAPLGPMGVPNVPPGPGVGIGAAPLGPMGVPNPGNMGVPVLPPMGLPNEGGKPGPGVGIAGPGPGRNPNPGPGPGPAVADPPGVVPGPGIGQPQPGPGPGPGPGPIGPGVGPGPGFGGPAGLANGFNVPPAKLKLDNAFHAIAFDTEANDFFAVGARREASGRISGVLRHYSYPDFALKGTYYIPHVATRAVLDSKGTLYLATLFTAGTSYTGIVTDRTSGRGDIEVFEIGQIRSGAVKEKTEFKPAATMPVGDTIRGLELTPDGATLYCVSTGVGPKSSKLFQFDTATRKQAKVRALPKTAGGIYLAARGQQILIPDLYTNAKAEYGVTVINPANWDEEEKAPPIPGVCNDLAPAKGQTLVGVCAQGNAAKLYLLDLTGKPQREISSLGGAANNGYVAFSPDASKLFVASAHSVGLDVYEVSDKTDPRNGYKKVASIQQAQPPTVEAAYVGGYFHVTPDGEHLVFHTGAVLEVSKLTDNVPGSSPLPGTAGANNGPNGGLPGPGGLQPGPGGFPGPMNPGGIFPGPMNPGGVFPGPMNPGGNFPGPGNPGGNPMLPAPGQLGPGQPGPGNPNPGGVRPGGPGGNPMFPAPGQLGPGQPGPGNPGGVPAGPMIPAGPGLPGGNKPGAPGGAPGGVPGRPGGANPSM